MFPTFTTPNAASMATGHKVGDTGNFGNTLGAGFPVPAAGDSLDLLVELVKADFLALRGGWEQSNWAGNEGQLEIAPPVGTGP
jgi:hypothetical protein